MIKKFIKKHKDSIAFTLIELLAVIVILAVIALIVTPIVSGVIKNAKKSSFRASVLNLLHGTEVAVQANSVTSNGNNDYSLLCTDNKCYNEDISVLFSGKKLVSGLVFADIKGNSKVQFITDGEFCANGNKDNLEIADACYKLDKTEAEIDTTLINLTSTTNSISVNLDTNFVIDKESGIKKILIKLYKDDEQVDYIEAKGTGNYTFEKLKDDTIYKVVVEIINGNNIINSYEDTISTKLLEKPYSKLISIPSSSVNGYYKSQTLEVKYSENNIYNNYIKVTKDSIMDLDAIGSCGSDTLPGDCVDIKTNELAKDTWYLVPNEIKIVYDYDIDDTATVYLTVNDGTNFSKMSTVILSKIDATNPSVSLGNASITSKSIVIPITASDDHSGNISATCKYTTKQTNANNGNYEVNASNVSTSSCTLSTSLTHNTTYYYQVCIKDGVGNTDCKTGNSATTRLSITPAVSSNNPTTSVNGYYKSQVWTFNTTGNPTTYYVKTTRAATSNIASTHTCGTATDPASCSSSAVTSLAANTWYAFSSKPTITYNKTAGSTATIYAKVSDGQNNSSNGSSTVSKIDVTAPSCTSSKTNTNTTSGVTATFTCSDDNVGITNCTSQKTGLTSSQSYSISDDLGNTSTCSVTVSSKTQYSKRSCSSGNRCASAGCQTYNSCAHSSCGVAYYTYNYCQHSECGTTTTCPSGTTPSGGACLITGVTVTKETAASTGVCKHPANDLYDYNAQGTCYHCPYGWVGYNRTNCYKDATVTTNSCRTSGCGIESTTYNSCPNSSCSCNTYNESASTCGCASWGSWTSWSDSSSNYCSNSNTCQGQTQTVYY